MFLTFSYICGTDGDPFLFHIRHVKNVPNVAASVAGIPIPRPTPRPMLVSELRPEGGFDVEFGVAEGLAVLVALVLVLVIRRGLVPGFAVTRFEGVYDTDLSGDDVRTALPYPHTFSYAQQHHNHRSSHDSPLAPTTVVLAVPVFATISQYVEKTCIPMDKSTLARSPQLNEAKVERLV
jgi:hypothetical protein